LRDLCYYLIHKLCYPGENRAMPPRLRYFVYFLDFEIYCASRCSPCDSAAVVLLAVASRRRSAVYYQIFIMLSWGRLELLIVNQQHTTRPYGYYIIYMAVLQQSLDDQIRPVQRKFVEMSTEW